MLFEFSIIVVYQELVIYTHIILHTPRYIRYIFFVLSVHFKFSIRKIGGITFTIMYLIE